MLALRMVTSKVAEVFHLLHKYDVVCMNRISVNKIKESRRLICMQTCMNIRKSQTDTEKQKVQICTPLIKLIAFSCKSWILSTKNVEKLVFTSCKMQLSDNLSINNKSLSKPRIVHIF